jgi:cytidylate kinase
MNLALSANALAEASVLTPDADEVWLRRATERVLVAAGSSDTVVVGRAAAIVLRDRDDALHVRLDGPRAARIRQGAEAFGIPLDDAERRLDHTDRARAAYVRELYGMDWRDLTLYHIVLDSTALSLDAATDLIVAAAHARLGVTVKR